MGTTFDLGGVNSGSNPCAGVCKHVCVHACVHVGGTLTTPRLCSVSFLAEAGIIGGLCVSHREEQLAGFSATHARTHIHVHTHTHACAHTHLM